MPLSLSPQSNSDSDFKPAASRNDCAHNSRGRLAAVHYDCRARKHAEMVEKL